MLDIIDATQEAAGIVEKQVRVSVDATGYGWMVSDVTLNWMVRSVFDQLSKAGIHVVKSKAGGL